MNVYVSRCVDCPCQVLLLIACDRAPQVLVADPGCGSLEHRQVFESGLAVHGHDRPHTPAGEHRVLGTVAATEHRHVRGDGEVGLPEPCAHPQLTVSIQQDRVGCEEGGPDSEATSEEGVQ